MPEVDEGVASSGAPQKRHELASRGAHCRRRLEARRSASSAGRAQVVARARRAGTSRRSSRARRSSARRGLQPSRARAFDAVEPAGSCASCGCSPPSVLPARAARPSAAPSAFDDPSHRRASSSAAGPKFQPPANAPGRSHSRSASSEVAGSGSSTCCHGPHRVGIADRRPARRAAPPRTRSGTSRSSRPVAAADHVAGARRCDRGAARPPKNESPVRGGDELRRRPCCCCRDRGRPAARPRGSRRADSRFS